VFEAYFATPQGVDFGQLCRTYGVEHQIITNLWDLKDQWPNNNSTAIRVLEIIGDRHQEAQWLKLLQAKFCQADSFFQ
jgi:2-succinyl-5-enolpyruvyl-6-hydroxy-3-cyclohexene-1-carboxylate synthase